MLQVPEALEAQLPYWRGPVLEKVAPLGYRKVQDLLITWDVFLEGVVGVPRTHSCWLSQLCPQGTSPLTRSLVSRWGGGHAQQCAGDFTWRQQSNPGLQRARCAPCMLTVPFQPANVASLVQVQRALFGHRRPSPAPPRRLIET